MLLLFSGSAINWKAALQSTVTLSTTEAVYMTVTEVEKETIWLRDLVEALNLHQGVTTMFCDSQSAIQLMKH